MKLFVSSFLFFFITPIMCLALPDPSEPFDASKLSKAEISEMAASFGVPVENKRFQDWLYGRQQDEYYRLKENPAPIVKHLKGDKGIKFPSAEAASASLDLEEKPDAKTLEMAAEYDRMVAKYQKSELEIDTQPISNSIERCQKSHRTEQIVSDQAEEKPVLKMDLLYLDRAETELINVDVFEVYGLNTEVIFLDRKRLEDQEFAKLNQIQCLPTRIRATKSKIFQEQGAYALRNYDKDQLGPGELHPSLSEQAKRFGGE